MQNGAEAAIPLKAPSGASSSADAGPITLTITP